jgi:hypothetical protein
MYYATMTGKTINKVEMVMVVNDTAIHAVTPVILGHRSKQFGSTTVTVTEQVNGVTTKTLAIGPTGWQDRAVSGMVSFQASEAGATIRVTSTFSTPNEYAGIAAYLFDN